MKQFSVKTILVLLYALTMTACASMHGQSRVWLADGTEVISSSQTSNLDSFQLKPLPVEIAQVELKVPELEVKEIPMRSNSRFLADRARIRFTETEIKCMAEVIYYEARGEGTTGMIGVGYTVLNRMGSEKFKPTTACGVVYETNRRGCQFSWVCDGKPDRIRNRQTYERVREIALQVMKREVPNPVGNSLYFRHRGMKSRYASSQRLYANIGQHGFYVAIR